MSTLTAANCSFALAITNLYTSPQTLSGFSLDDSFSSNAIETKESQIDLRGGGHFGYKFAFVDISMLILPDTPDAIIFQTWVNAEAALKDVLTANASINIPSIGMKYTLTNGALWSHKPFPDVKKFLQPMPFVIRWESVVGVQS
jgi:hypothetical protein